MDRKNVRLTSRQKSGPSFFNWKIRKLLGQKVQELDQIWTDENRKSWTSLDLKPSGDSFNVEINVKMGSEIENIETFHRNFVAKTMRNC